MLASEKSFVQNRVGVRMPPILNAECRVPL